MRIIRNNGCDYNADAYNNYDFPDAPAEAAGRGGWSRAEFQQGVFAAADFPAFGQQENLGRNTFRGPGYANMDLALMRSFVIRTLPGKRRSREYAVRTLGVQLSGA